MFLVRCYATATDVVIKAELSLDVLVVGCSATAIRA